MSGTPGYRGRDGLKGLPGLLGLRGETGLTGSQGQQGDEGLPGRIGFKGDFGKNLFFHSNISRIAKKCLFTDFFPNERNCECSFICQ